MWRIVLISDMGLVGQVITKSTDIFLDQRNNAIEIRERIAGRRIKKKIDGVKGEK